MFIESQVKWHFLQRVNGNLFTREELRILLELGTHFLDYQEKMRGRFDRDAVALNAGSDAELRRLAVELNVDYRQAYESNVLHDLSVDKAATLAKLKALLDSAKEMIDLGSKWLADFLAAVEVYLKMERGTSDRLIVRAGLSNQGVQDGVMQTEARMKFGEQVFRLPIQVASRPWEGDEGGPSQYYVIEPKTFRVVDFVLDARLNAPADVEKFRKALRGGTTVDFSILGISGEVLADWSFRATLN